MKFFLFPGKCNATHTHPGSGLLKGGAAGFGGGAGSDYVIDQQYMCVCGEMGIDFKGRGYILPSVCSSFPGLCGGKLLPGKYGWLHGYGDDLCNTIGQHGGLVVSPHFFFAGKQGYRYQHINISDPGTFAELVAGLPAQPGSNIATLPVFEKMDELLYSGRLTVVIRGSSLLYVYTAVEYVCYRIPGVAVKMGER